MARNPQPPQDMSLTPDEMRAGVTRFKRRLAEIEQFDPQAMTSRRDPRIDTLEAAIAGSLADTFREGTQAYKRYAQAKKIDTASYNMNGTPQHEVIEGLVYGKERATAMLSEAVRYLEEKLEEIQHDAGATNTVTIATKSLSNEIFIVHGHDETAKNQVALLIERAGLKPIILHEQANGGKTIIEKFEKHGSAVGFAVVIASPDDVGGLAVSPPGEPDLKPRARQNVVGEMFWFAGRLGRAKVCALVKGNIDMPSDFAGVVYTPMDDHGGWKSKLLQELAAAGYQNLNWQAALA
jgi:predicted nucleotide-binding protein